MRGFGGCAPVVCAMVLAACGGGERQDADEPSGDFRVEVVSASFPTRQSLADETQLEIEVRNADDETAPNVAVTISTESGPGTGEPAFATTLQGTDVADRSRPIWIVDEPPPGGDTAATDTWALGPLKPGQTKRAVWKLTAVRAGTYTVGYTVYPGLTGKARPEGNDNKGSFKVRISDVPPEARVDESGNVVRGTPSAN